MLSLSLRQLVSERFQQIGKRGLGAADDPFLVFVKGWVGWTVSRSVRGKVSLIGTRASEAKTHKGILVLALSLSLSLSLALELSHRPSLGSNPVG